MAMAVAIPGISVGAWSGLSGINISLLPSLVSVGMTVSVSIQAGAVVAVEVRVGATLTLTLTRGGYSQGQQGGYSEQNPHVSPCLPVPRTPHVLSVDPTA